MSDKNHIEIVGDLGSFDRRSGNVIERLIFNNRLLIVAVCALLTAFFAMQLPTLRGRTSDIGTT